ncbi:hypothetical protein [Flagellimonas marina]|uniref:Uncharacterized protein n=1 Tax=Flagellimonas marina TaxID=1775168 RepID=A0ABV8PGB5_9FLAO
MTTKDLELYLAQTGHHGNYEDALYNCFCDNPKTAGTKVTQLELSTRTASGGKSVQTVNIDKITPSEYAALIRAQRGIKEAIRWVRSSNVDTNTMIVVDVRDGYAYYISKKPAPVANTTTPKPTVKPVQTVQPTKTVQPKGEVVTTKSGGDMVVTETPDNLENIQAGQKKLGGNWLWYLLIGGLALGAITSSGPKVVEA